ncbi:MAG: squalene/phytoene synthase family protein, partial [Anaerolineae bacterium]
DNWRAFVKFQIDRARHYYGRSVKGIKLITDVGSRFVVCAMGEIYGGILGVIERNDYDVFSERAHVKGREKAMTALRILFRRQYV